MNEFSQSIDPKTINTKQPRSYAAQWMIDIAIGLVIGVPMAYGVLIYLSK